MDGGPGRHGVSFPMEAVSPIGIDAAVTSLNSKSPVRRNAICKARRKLDLEFLFPVRLVGARRSFFVFLFPFGLNGQVSDPNQVAVGKVPLNDGFELEFIFLARFAR